MARFVVADITDAKEHPRRAVVFAIEVYWLAEC
jgi:hypothetical protein